MQFYVPLLAHRESSVMFAEAGGRRIALFALKRGIAVDRGETLPDLQF